MQISDEHFDKLITRAMDELPQEYISGLDNVAIVQADDPTDEQKQKIVIKLWLVFFAPIFTKRIHPSGVSFWRNIYVMSNKY